MSPAMISRILVRLAVIGAVVALRMPADAFADSAAGAATSAAANSAAQPRALPRIARLDNQRITVSGVSSGAAMAVQLGVAYSGRVSGVGIIGGPPYLCADGSLLRAFNTCLIFGGAWLDRLTGSTPTGAGCQPREGRPLDLPGMIEATRGLEKRKAIDPIAGIAGQKVWEFRGRCDEVVGNNASVALAGFYRQFGAELRAATRPDVGHTLPTDKPDQGPCNAEDKDYISSCNFDAVGEMLHHLLPGAPAARAPAGGEWLRFDQAAYVEGGQDADRRVKSISMAREGRLFVPAICAARSCTVHVALHGCQQGIDDAVFENFVRQSGYAEWANSIGLVVLFPRVTALDKFDSLIYRVGNPQGCWDWWGYTNASFGDALRYASRDAPQMRAIMSTVGALAGP
ncbi:MAG: hypothetical protein IPL03_09730 [Sterolibacteriaceae bacterium]|nr:hypothetical protein [Candidatus Methylophosphatis haderslevensis]